ncbi:hypothetical protein TPHA_0D01630 [Tetrapisispora phaffii CBS 4417]|uniref:PH domain-containing protein n=1 Tax=Tetrapisispora phaffii (strain ATCC 24235 / CBS 4417 / NBRC 1672 / NRRL Y-8282 / UCD 70-5) TaxID=1071381 RepID=G8BSI2_TETPH|nr:hypothetical protein TPHA_0D01630 [Tetrapisispora phaffii CBS 4417]CCE62803.1 hypothetical protein TPHA_0D01630 [Tetrapisispora phaffii CBS 4417]
MSKHNTMTSTMSDILPQQHRNLQQLQNLQNRTKSLGVTNDYNPAYLQSIQNNLLNNNMDPNGKNFQLPLSTINTNQSNSNSKMDKAYMGSGAPLLFNSTANGLAPDVQRSSSTATNTVPNLNTSDVIFQHKTPAVNSATPLSRQNMQQDPRSPLVVLIPTNSHPTEILATRFTAWRSVIKSLVTYLSEASSIQDEIVRQQLRLTHAIEFPFFSIENLYQPSSQEDKNNQNFFLSLGNGSVQDLPTILNLYHSSLASNASKVSKELSSDIIPRLRDLRGDLLIKIKEIKVLNSDFKNSCQKELQKTKDDLKVFLQSIEEARYGTPKQDPYLTKLVLNRQIKKQLSEENFLHEAFDNLQSSAEELEKVVVMEIQNALTNYAKLLGQQSQLVFDVLISKLDTGFFSKNPNFEWENFIARDPNFILPDIPMRKMNSIIYKNQNDPLTYEITSGYLEKRSKFLKAYSKGYYVLSPSFLHEFKSPDRKKDLVPIMSLPLNECTVTEHSRKGSSDYKFILHSKQNGLIIRGHNWVLKSDSYENMMLWYNLINDLTKLTDHQAKVDYVIKKINLTGDAAQNVLLNREALKDEERIDKSINVENDDQNYDDLNMVPEITVSSPIKR